MSGLEAHLRSRRDAGSKLLVPYVTAGFRDDWVDVVRGVAAAGADAVEIGIPFSDPVMDGPVIQAASLQALQRGVTPASILDDLRTLNVDVPLAVMTYFNLVFRFGYERLAGDLADAGVAAAILPDMPMEESDGWRAAARAVGIETVMFVAPNTPEGRMKQICDAAEGFVYAIGTLGVTGEREQLAASARTVGSRAKQLTDKPVLVGIGISNGEQAREVASYGDGVIVGSALVRRLLDGETPAEAAAFIAELRSALDEG